MENGYGGWKNHATWNLYTWLSTDETLYRHWTEKAEMLATRLPSLKDAKFALADSMKQAFGHASFLLHGPENVPGTATGVLIDMVNATLDSVDWDELAQAFIAPIAESRVTCRCGRTFPTNEAQQDHAREILQKRQEEEWAAQGGQGMFAPHVESGSPEQVRQQTEIQAIRKRYCN